MPIYFWIERNSVNFDDLITHHFPSHRLISVLGQNDFFGEIAIEQRIPRTASVITKSPCDLGVLTYESY
jgi:CRP-like cAMP-binding protein